MFTVIGIKIESVEKPTHLIFQTDEETPVHVLYRFGFLRVVVDDETLHKVQLTKDYTSSKMSEEDIVEYLEEYLPEEMLTFSLTKKEKDGTSNE